MASTGGPAGSVVMAVGETNGVAAVDVRPRNAGAATEKAVAPGKSSATTRATGVAIIVIKAVASKRGLFSFAVCRFRTYGRRSVTQK